jgi:hypothetical protein
MPIILITHAQNIALGQIGGHRAFGVELFGIAYNPQQFSQICAANPVAADGGVFTCGFAQHFAQGVQTDLGDRRLPGALAFAFAELIQNTAGFGQRALLALADEQDVHTATVIWAAIASLCRRWPALNRHCKGFTLAGQRFKVG